MSVFVCIGTSNAAAYGWEKQVPLSVSLANYPLIKCPQISAKLLHSVIPRPLPVQVERPAAEWRDVWAEVLTVELANPTVVRAKNGSIEKYNIHIYGASGYFAKSM